MRYWHSASLAKVRPRSRRMYFRLSRSLSKSTIRFPYLTYYCPTKPLLGSPAASPNGVPSPHRLEYLER
jgi:hypothetical protein